MRRKASCTMFGSLMRCLLFFFSSSSFEVLLHTLTKLIKCGGSTCGHIAHYDLLSLSCCFVMFLYSSFLCARFSVVVSWQAFVAIRSCFFFCYFFFFVASILLLVFSDLRLKGRCFLFSLASLLRC